MTPDEIEQMKADIEAGTPGPWRAGQHGNFRVYGPDGIGEHSGLIAEVLKGKANAYRIARVPQLEAEVLRLWVAMHWASELERVAKNLADYDQNAPGASQVRTVINAYRSALKVIDHDT